jgi:hypothetical protein
MVVNYTQEECNDRIQIRQSSRFQANLLAIRKAEPLRIMRS